MYINSWIYAYNSITLMPLSMQLVSQSVSQSVRQAGIVVCITLQHNRTLHPRLTFFKPPRRFNMLAAHSTHLFVERAGTIIYIYIHTHTHTHLQSDDADATHRPFRPFTTLTAFTQSICPCCMHAYLYVYM